VVLSSRIKEGAVGAAVLIGFVVALMAILTDQAMLDWDTYVRANFIVRYDPTTSVDTHVLYHVLLSQLFQWGVPPMQGIFALTAGSLGWLLASGWWVAGERGLGGSSRSLVVAMLLCASPGLIGLTLMAEDNLSYLPPVLCFLHLVTMGPSDPKQEWRRGFGAGIALAVAMLFNVTALIFLVIVPLAVVAWLLKRHAEARCLTGTILAFALTYYGFYWIVNTGGEPALHRYIVQAASLKDFGENPEPVMSLTRMQHFVFGARAMFLTPTMYRMDLPGGVSVVPLVYAPLLLVVAYGLLGVWWARQKRESETMIWVLVPLALLGVTLVFPYLYEPLLIERWDMFWMFYFLALISWIKARPRMGMEVVLASAIMVQVCGSVVVVRHHFFGAYEKAADTEMRAMISEVEMAGHKRIVLPMNMDRQRVAHMVHHLPGRAFYLVGQNDLAVPMCWQVDPLLAELPVPCERVARRVLGTTHTLTHWDAEGTLQVIEAAQ
jgi:hypothetical protein